MVFNYIYTDRMRPYLEQRNKQLIEGNVEIDLILFGDSILQGYDFNRYYPVTLKVVNSAIGGDRIQYMVQRFEEDVLKLQPKQVLFLGGINNIRAWYNEQRSIDEIPEIVAEVVDGYVEIIKMATQNGITIYPVLITQNQEEKHNHQFINEIVNLTNTKLKKLEEIYDVKFIDFNQCLCNEYGSISLDLAPDGLHPNELGYLQITNLLLKEKIIK